MSTEDNNKEEAGSSHGHHGWTAVVEHQIHGDVADCDEIDAEMGLASPHQDASTRSINSITSNMSSSLSITGTSNERPPLLCPLTKQPLQDPVVNPTNGFSYERSAIDCEDEDRDQYIPNRVLKDYLQAVQGLQEEDSATMDHSGRSMTSSSKDLLDLLVCPITQELLEDPVIDHEGNTYERTAIVDWIQQHGDSPITRNPLSAQQLYDNNTLTEVIIKETVLYDGDGAAVLAAYHRSRIQAKRNENGVLDPGGEPTVIALQPNESTVRYALPCLMKLSCLSVLFVGFILLMHFMRLSKLED
ncbi:U-box domain-containing protein [Seminavis robusta]|uniref:U-box domain-containing protein n=1 Tax=Seminavis robusta TaxID=568900 RepID=A0A9N8HLG4_9STRA|nr:U-box domain-containing protein [Seminavis robusta]|eukprot:Sro681_g186380.1 U-box domain-containing protein (302) ;mRNA; f:15330-16235